MSSPIVILFLIFFLMPVYGENFVYEFSPGDRYRIVSEVTQRVYYNEEFSHDARFQNIIGVHIIDATEKEGSVRARYRVLEEITRDSEVQVVRQEHDVTYTISHDGEVSVPADAFVPMVRNIPRFPAHALSVGDTWAFTAEEVFDFRSSFGIPRPFRVKSIVAYEYLGVQESTYDRQRYHAIGITYPLEITRLIMTERGTIIISMFGSTDQVLLWDSARGRAHSYAEEYRFGWKVGDDMVEFVGNATAYTIDVSADDEKARYAQVERALAQSSLEDVSVGVDEDGVVLNIGKLQFIPDSATLLPGEEEKIMQIAELIALQKPAQVLVVGHTTNAGTKEGQQALSEVRARTVGTLLQRYRIRNLIIQGVGATRPIADNKTRSGKQQNRRVEIKLIGNEGETP